MGSKPRVKPAVSSASLLEPFAKVAPGVELSVMFGKPCLKRAGKAFAAEFRGALVFKLESDAGAHKKALALPGARLWDPSGKNRPMKAWVEVPGSQSRHWTELCRVAAGQA